MSAIKKNIIRFKYPEKLVNPFEAKTFTGPKISIEQPSGNLTARSNKVDAKKPFTSMARYEPPLKNLKKHAMKTVSIDLDMPAEQTQ